MQWDPYPISKRHAAKESQISVSVETALAIYSAVIAMVDANEICEHTSCDTLKWLKCAGVLTACAAACVDPDLPSCVACLGSLYDECKKCYSLDIDTKKAVNDAKYMFNAYRKQNYCRKSYGLN